MKYITLLIFLTLFSFQGCAKKQNITPPSQNNTPTKNHIAVEVNISKKESLDEFEDEFDEFSDKNDVAIIDPLSGYNRIMTSFNDKVFEYALNPLSKGYAAITPEPVRQSLSNFIHNIQFPIRFANNLLQGKFQNSSDELERFIVNSTFGIGGFFDPASIYMKIPAHNEDFGQTLGHYGVGAGFHIVLPFLGPSNVRDVVGLTADGYTSPLVYQKGLKKYKLPEDYLQSAGIKGGEIVNKNSLHLGAYESLKKDAINLYPFLREIYEQKRITDIKE